MKLRFNRWFFERGGFSAILGWVILASFILLLSLPSWRESHVIPFLLCFSLAGTAYWLAMVRLDHDRLQLGTIWTLAVLMRLVVLSSSPSLSDDVYRYIWDGHLMRQGINPYQSPVDAAVLDPYEIPERGLVNHPEMASPYLPAAQAYFAIVQSILPTTQWGFQFAAVILDLGAGFLVMLILSKLELARRAVLLYLWNPLVVIEFAHSAHLDILMLVGMLASLYWLLPEKRADPSGWRVAASAIALSLATLIKGIPLLIAPLLSLHWRRKGVLIFSLGIIVPLLVAIPEAGLGLTGPLDGTGLFGAFRIYQRYWNFNGGIYHWLEVWLTGANTAGAVPVTTQNQDLIQTLRLALGAVLALITIMVAFFYRRKLQSMHNHPLMWKRDLSRLTAIPLAAFLLLSPTVHPWYVTIILPWLTFWYPAETETTTKRFIWPWIYFSLIVVFSYLSYFNPLIWREFRLVRYLEYLPLYLLLLWSAWPWLLNLSRNPAHTNEI